MAVSNECRHANDHKQRTGATMLFAWHAAGPALTELTDMTFEPLHVVNAPRVQPPPQRSANEPRFDFVDT